MISTFHWGDPPEFHWADTPDGWVIQCNTHEVPLAECEMCLPTRAPVAYWDAFNDALKSGPPADPDASLTECEDCSGTGWYVGLNARELCSTCDGSGYL